MGLWAAGEQITAAKLNAMQRDLYFFRARWDERTVVTGTWAQNVAGSQTDYDPYLTSVAGYIFNSSNANLNELHFGSVSLTPGTYKVVVSFQKNSSYGILEILHDTTSIGTVDLYNASSQYNQVASFTYSPAAYKTGNLRVRVNGKNASSTGYYITPARIEIIRTG